MKVEEKERHSPIHRESAGVLTIISITFALIILFICLIFYFMYSSLRLSLENTIEKTFNRVFLALSTYNRDEIESLLHDSDIVAVGIYKSDGTPILYYGPNTGSEGFEIKHFTDTNVPFFKESNVIGYDVSNKLIECIRVRNFEYSYYDIDAIPLDVLSQSGADIVFFALRATEYFSSLITLFVGLAISILISIGAFVFLLLVFIQNSKFKTRLREQEALVAMGQAARTLTHEIKNPLSAITLQVALLKRLAPESLQDDLKVVESEAKRLTMLTNRVSEYLRNPNGEPELISLKGAIESVEAQFPSDIYWDIDSQGEANILFDQDRVRSVLVNIIENAVEASPGKTAEISVRLSKKGAFYKVTVEDHGKGIKAEDMKEVFNPFYTTKIHGAGIGVPISIQFMRAAGGELSIKSESGKGTTVTLLFRAAGKSGGKNESSDLR